MSKTTHLASIVVSFAYEYWLVRETYGNRYCVTAGEGFSDRDITPSVAPQHALPILHRIARGAFRREARRNAQAAAFRQSMINETCA